MVKRKRKISARYLYVGKDFGTVAIQNKYGKMQGRKKIRGRGDSTAVLRVKKGHPRAGEILGRTRPIPIKGSKRARAHLRRTL